MTARINWISRRDAAGAEAVGAMRLWAEFIVLYVVAPLLLAIFIKQVSLFASIGAVTAIGLLLLRATPSFEWRELWDVKSLRGYGPLIAAFAVGTAVVITAATLWLAPDRFLFLAYERPWILPIIWALYPWFSVLGQEILYRSLFFHRYGPLFPNASFAIVVNGVLFGLAHLFYQNWVAVTFSAAGGLIFGWLYARTRSFPLVFVLHWIAGGIIFTAGLGVYFFHGNIR